MANKYFTQLTQLTAGSVASGDAFAVEDISAGETKYITAQDTATYLTSLIGAGGWNAVAGTWTYSSAATITVPTGAASIYNKGMPIRWKQGAGYKYGNILTVADTSLTIFVNTDYTVANSAITDMYYSTSPMPLDFPQWFNFNPAPAGYSSNPTSTYYMYSVIGKTVRVKLYEGGDGTSNATTKSYTIPGTRTVDMPLAFRAEAIKNNGVDEYGGVIYVTGSGTLTLGCGRAGAAAWTNSGACRVFGNSSLGVGAVIAYPID